MNEHKMINVKGTGPAAKAGSRRTEVSVWHWKKITAPRDGSAFWGSPTRSRAKPKKKEEVKKGQWKKPTKPSATTHNTNYQTRLLKKCSGHKPTTPQTNPAMFGSVRTAGPPGDNGAANAPTKTKPSTAAAAMTAATGPKNQSKSGGASTMLCNNCLTILTHEEKRWFHCEPCQEHNHKVLQNIQENETAPPGAEENENENPTNTK